MKPLDPLASTPEPLRVRDGGGSELDRRLVGSARLDSAPSAARARLAAALGVPEQGMPGASVAAGGSAPGAGLLRAGWGRVAWVGAASVVGAVIAWRALVPAPVQDDPVSAAPVSAPAELATGRHSQDEGARPPSPASLEEPPRSEVAAESPVPAPAPAPQPVRHRPRTLTPPARDVAVPERGHGLLEEVSLLDRARAQLETPQRAAHVLAEYERRFPRGELTLEAELLRVDVAARAGQRDEAVARARTLLAKPGGARYRARLAPLLSGASGAPGAGSVR
jgi:hypothetical protein